MDVDEAARQWLRDRVAEVQAAGNDLSQLPDTSKADNPETFPGFDAVTYNYGQLLAEGVLTLTFLRDTTDPADDGTVLLMPAITDPTTNKIRLSESNVLCNEIRETLAGELRLVDQGATFLIPASA